MSDVKFREWCICYVVNIFLMSIGSMSHVDFKKMLCRPVGFKGQGPCVLSKGWPCVTFDTTRIQCQEM